MALSVTYFNSYGAEETAKVLAVYYDSRFDGYDAVRFLLEDRGHRCEPTVHSLPVTDVVRFHGTENERLRFWELHDDGSSIAPDHLAAAFAEELAKNA